MGCQRGCQTSLYRGTCPNFQSPVPIFFFICPDVSRSHKMSRATTIYKFPGNWRMCRNHSVFFPPSLACVFTSITRRRQTKVSWVRFCLVLVCSIIIALVRQTVASQVFWFLNSIFLFVFCSKSLLSSNVTVKTILLISTIACCFCQKFWKKCLICSFEHLDW